MTNFTVRSRHLTFKAQRLFKVPPCLILTKLHTLPTECIYYLYGPQDKQQLSHYTIVTEWFV